MLNKQVSFKYKGDRFIKGIVNVISKNIIVVKIECDYVGKNNIWESGSHKNFNLKEIKSLQIHEDRT